MFILLLILLISVADEPTEDIEDMADLKTQFIVTMNQENPDRAVIAHLQKKTFLERMLENHLHVQPRYTTYPFLLEEKFVSHM